MKWIKGFKQGVDEIKNVSDYNVSFRTTKGYNTNMTVKYGTQVDQLLRKYLKMENRTYLIGSNRICFLYNAKKLNLEDKTPVEFIFNNDNNPSILVNDTYRLIGEENRFFTFETSRGKIITFYFNINLSVEKLLDCFFVTIGKEQLKGNDKITFMYNKNQIRPNDFNIEIGNYFKNNNNPKIIVKDPKNLI